jgi:hypothetical protein
MARSTGPVLALGAITLGNNVILHGKDVAGQARVVVGTTILAAGLALIEHASEGLAVGLAWLALVSVLFVRITPGVPAPIESLATWLNEGK